MAESVSAGTLAPMGVARACAGFSIILTTNKRTALSTNVSRPYGKVDLMHAEQTPMQPEQSVLFQAHDVALKAQDFLIAAQRCGKASFDNIDDWLPVPQVVNCAFAIELALKGLQLICLGDAKPGHHLDKLFERLPAEVQNEICRDVDADSFISHLQKARSAFAEWRYSHEADGITIDYGFLEWMATRTIGILGEKIRISL